MNIMNLHQDIADLSTDIHNAYLMGGDPKYLRKAITCLRRLSLRATKAPMPTLASPLPSVKPKKLFAVKTRSIVVVSPWYRETLGRSA